MLLKLISLILIGFGLVACKISTPLSGPGYDSDKGVLASKNDKFIVSVTYVELSDNKRLTKTFWSNVEKVTGYLAAAPSGLIAYSLRREIIGKQAWTMTIWEDETSLMEFVNSPTHQQAMKQSYSALNKVGFVRFEVNREDIPVSWKKAEQMLKSKEQNNLEIL